MPTFVPEDSIVAIVRGTPKYPMGGLLGTGFIVGKPDSPSVITARHVVEGVTLGTDEHLGIAFRKKEGVSIVANPRILLHEKFDVAVLDGSDLRGTLPMAFAHGTPPQNVDILGYEYSSTRFEPLESGTMQVSIEPHMHKGNITLHYVSRFPEKVPTPSFLTSFPALKGASGAPVFLSHNVALVGMLVANFERHLMPAQVVRVDTDEGATEETSYFLPMGKALAAPAIMECLDELGIQYDQIPWIVGMPNRSPDQVENDSTA